MISLTNFLEQTHYYTDKQEFYDFFFMIELFSVFILLYTIHSSQFVCHS